MLLDTIISHTMAIISTQDMFKQLDTHLANVNNAWASHTARVFSAVMGIEGIDMDRIDADYIRTVVGGKSVRHALRNWASWTPFSQAARLGPKVPFKLLVRNGRKLILSVLRSTGISQQSFRNSPKLLTMPETSSNTFSPSLSAASITVWTVRCPPPCIALKRVNLPFMPTGIKVKREGNKSN